MRIALLFCLFSYILQAQTPRLVVPIGHTDFITSVAFSPDGKNILTGSYDCSTKLWDLSGRELQTFKADVIGLDEVINAVVFSPDGKWIGTGSANGTLRLWDFSGNTLKAFKTPDKSICSMAVSPDGKWLLTGNGQNSATLWDLSTWGIIATFKGNDEISSARDYPAVVSSVAFSPDGKQVLTGGLDRTAKIWDSSGKELKSFDNPLKDVEFAAFSPDGKAVLTCSFDGSVNLWDVFSGAELRAFEGHSGPVRSAAFSPDGNWVLTGSSDKTAKLWNVLSGKEFVNFSGHLGGINSVAFSPDGKQVLTGSHDRSAKLWDLSGRVLQTFTGHTSGISSVGFSPDGKKTLTENYNNSVMSWDLSGGAVQTFKGSVPNPSYGLSAVSPDKKLTLRSNLDYTLTLSDSLGRVLCTLKGHIGHIKSMAFSPANSDDPTGGRLILTGSDDHTAKLWDTNTGALLATLITLDSTNWVVTTPSGLFDASPGTMKSLHYVVGMEVIVLDQLKARYWQPGLLQKILNLSRGGLRNVEAFDSVALQPVIKATIEKNKLRITLTERSGGLGKLILYINKKEMSADINPNRQKTLTVNLDDFYPADITETIGLVAYDAINWLKSQTYELPYKSVSARGENSGEPERFDCGPIEPKLYLLMIGTSKYSDVSKRLTYPDLDAAEMAKALGSTGKALFKDSVELKLLSTAGGEAEDPSKINIEKAFRGFAQKATPCDILVVFFSGHGSAWGKEGDKPNFYYLTKDITSAQLADDKVRAAYAVSDEDLKKWLVAIKARKQVLILDACNSGQAAENLSGIGHRDLNASQVIAFDILKDRTGTFILSGSASDMLSYEAAEYGQGLLTYSLLEGISGTALKGNQVDIMVLFQNSRDVVPKLAQGIKRVQIPVISAPYEAASFPIGIKDSTVQIVLPQRKPVVIQCNFQDKVNYKDGLGLSQALNGYFQDQNAKGVQAKYVFYNILQYAEGFSIWGNYTIQGDQVSVGGRLFKGDKPVGEAFQLTGGKDPAELVKLILNKVNPLIKVK